MISIERAVYKPLLNKDPKSLPAAEKSLIKSIELGECQAITTWENNNLHEENNERIRKKRIWACPWLFESQ